VRRGGRAWLLADRATLAEARRQVRGSTLWFQRLQAWYLLAGAVRAPTVAAVAARAGLDPDRLEATLAAYNAAARDPAAPDPAGKPAAARRPQDQPPYALIDCSIRPRLFYPAPVLTLGGLVVDPGSGQVLRPDGSPIDGLYAAGRSAAGLCSRSYVSGLSLADCVFSGRRAGHHAAQHQARSHQRGQLSPRIRGFRSTIIRRLVRPRRRGAGVAADAARLEAAIIA
jgi:3-oxo-5alpha-steroid 4-dehydrogenase